MTALAETVEGVPGIDEEVHPEVVESQYSNEVDVLAPPAFIVPFRVADVSNIEDAATVTGVGAEALLELVVKLKTGP